MLKDLALADVKQEIAGTRRMLDRLPDGDLDWHPHERSMSIGDLATHLTNLLFWQLSILEKDEYDLASGPSRRDALASREAILTEFDGHAERVHAALERADDDSLRAEWVLRYGDREMFRMPRVAAYRSFGISHMVHHRAQLGVYLRLLDIPVPGVYGPTADEPAF